MPSKLIREVADYCWSKNFLDVFRNFFAEHGGMFENAPALSGGEHNMEYYSLFQVYLKLYENTLETYLHTLDVSIEEFYREVREAQDSTDDPYLMTFIDCLLASADYESFYKVMAKEGARSLLRKSAGKTAAAVAGVGGGGGAVADSKAEGKSIDRSDVYDAKGARGSQDNHADDKYSHK